MQTAVKGNSVVTNDRDNHVEGVKPLLLEVLFGCYFKYIKCDVLIEKRVNCSANVENKLGNYFKILE